MKRSCGSFCPPCRIVTTTIKNKKLGGLVINKVDSVTGKPLEGVQFKITYADGRFVDAEGGKLSSNGLYVTDQNGQIILNASSAQMSYVSDKPPGHGLIKVGGAIVPLVNEFPKDTSLYWLMTTKPGEG